MQPMSHIRSAIRSYFKSFSEIDPAVAVGLFGTGVGMAIPIAMAPSLSGEGANRSPQRRV